MSGPYQLGAAVYARRGLAVFPLRPASKAPATEHGFRDATTDLEVIERTARRHPRANLGIACAMSGVVVVDVDPRNGGDATLEDLTAQLGPLPATPTVLTAGGGLHFYLKAPAEARFVGSLGAGVDVKHEGYVVAPPSVGAGGRVYAWEASSRFDEVPFADIPRPWLSAMTTKARHALPSSGADAKESVLGQAFHALGWLGDVLEDGRRMVRCPWLAEHTDGRGDGNDSSTVLFPRASRAVLGGFRCAHGHCIKRTWRDVLGALPLHVQVAGARAMQVERTRLLLERFAHGG